MALPGIITILCHAGDHFPAISFHESPTYSISGAHDALSDAIAHDLNDTKDIFGKQPIAANDLAVTLEETTVTVDVLANDRRGGDDDDDDNDDDIDRETVDLDPARSGIQSSLSLSQGTYTVNDRGILTYIPALDFFGDAVIQYTVDSRDEKTSNIATVTITVNNVNDAPEVTGARGQIDAHAGQPITITLDHVAFTDPDNQPASDFYLEVLPGENYSVSGSTVTPSSVFSGHLPVSIQVADGTAMSAEFKLSLNVAATNESPAIMDQKPLTTNEDQAITITFGDLIVSDADNDYPEGFTIRLGGGDDYDVSGLTITPATDFNGELSVQVVVNDGTSDSDPFPLRITVIASNDRPVITGQVDLSIPENQSLSLMLTHLTVEDPDNAYPGAFTLSVSGGPDYSVSDNIITPAAGFNGTLVVPVSVYDGSLSSEPFHLSVSVTPTNDPPVITGQRPLEINEDTPIALSLQDLTVSDPDNTYPEGFSLAVQAGDHYSFTGTTITPELNFTGEFSVNVTVSDGTSNSEVYFLKISVLPQNDAPVITGHNPVTTNEDVSRTIGLADLMVSDPDNAYPAGFTLVVSPGVNYTLTGNTVTPAPDFSGTLDVQVQVSDGLISSNILNLPVQVVAVNDPPLITGQVPVQTAEDTPVTIQLSHLTVLDVDNNYPSGFTLIVSPGTNYTASGSTVLPGIDFNGTLNVNVMVNDGVSSSAPFAFQIQVGDANDPPAITGQTTLATNEEQAVTLALTHLTVFDPDNVYPTGFTCWFLPETTIPYPGKRSCRLLISRGY
jgi:hypothetical protein